MAMRSYRIIGLSPLRLLLRYSSGIQAGCSQHSTAAIHTDMRGKYFTGCRSSGFERVGPRPQVGTVRCRWPYCSAYTSTPDSAGSTGSTGSTANCTSKHWNSQLRSAHLCAIEVVLGLRVSTIDSAL